MVLNKRRAITPMLGGVLRDAGKMFADALRSTVDITGRAVNVIATRGGADTVLSVTEEEPQGMNPMVLYGVGAAVILLVAGIAMKKNRKRR